jgi:CRP-like cAMP-binding protein
MNFLEHLETADRERLLAAAKSCSVAKDDYLFRRGAPGGCLYWLEDGRLEIVDDRHHPELVLDIVGAGCMLGELAFVDEAPFTLDARAVEDCEVRWWAKGSMMAILAGDQGVAARFYEALSRSVVDLLRAQTGRALGGGSLQTSSSVAFGALSAGDGDDARSIASVPRTVWARADQRAKSGPGLGVAPDVSGALHALVDAVDVWLSGTTSLSRAQAAGAVLRTELRPWLMRSGSGSIGLEMATQPGVRLRFLAHLLLNSAQGDDPVGLALDEAILGLSTPLGLRWRMGVAVQEISAALPKGRPAMITLIQPSCGALLARFLPSVVAEGACVRCVDSDVQTLAFLDAGLRAQPAKVQLQMVHQDIVALNAAQPAPDDKKADVLVLNGLVDHLPSGLVGALLGWCRESLGPDGVLVLTAMGPSTDARFMDHVLGWPVVRRTPEELLGLLRAAGFKPRQPESQADQQGCGVVIVAKVATKP